MRRGSFAEPRGKRRGSYGILKAFAMVIVGMTLFLGAREFASLRPLDRYIDEGAVSFIPVDVVSDTRHYVRPHRWVRGFWTTKYWVVYESRGPGDTSGATALGTMAIAHTGSCRWAVRSRNGSSS